MPGHQCFGTDQLSPGHLPDRKLNILVQVFFFDDFPAVVRNNLLDSFKLIRFQNEFKRFPGRQYPET